MPTHIITDHTVTHKVDRDRWVYNNTETGITHFIDFGAVQYARFSAGDTDFTGVLTLQLADGREFGIFGEAALVIFCELKRVFTDKY